MKSISEIRNKKSELYTEYKQILQTVDSEGRSVTRRESDRLDEIEEHMEDLNAELERVWDRRERTAALGEDFFSDSDEPIAKRAFEDSDQDHLKAPGAPSVHTGDTMTDRSDGSEVIEFRDQAGNSHVGVRNPGEGDLYGALAERNGWPDMDSVETFGERIAPVLRGQSRDISSTGGLSGNIAEPARALVLDRLINQTFLRDAGAVFISPQSEALQVSRVTGGAGLEWLSPGSSASSTDPSFEAQTLDFKTFRGKIDINRETVQDASDLPSVVERELRATMSEEIERVALVGGEGSTAEPTGITASTDVNKVNIAGSTAGSAISSTGAGFDDILERKEALMNDNIPEDNISVTMAPRTARQFSVLKTTGNVYMDPPPQVGDLNRHVTAAMPTTFAPSTSISNASKIVVGDWSNALVGVRLEPTVGVTRAAESNSYQLSLVPAMRMDVVPQRPSGFEVIERITT